MKNNSLILALFLIGSVVTGSVKASPFSSLYVFGDSLSDSGSNPSSIFNVYKLLGNNCPGSHPCPPYYDGRLSNGPTAVEYLADAVLSGGATTSNFFNFAFVGATTGADNYVPGLPGMAQQLLNFSSNPAFASQAGANPLYFVWGGANDYLNNNSASGAAQNIVSYVSALALMGAETIIAPNLPDLSLTPYANTENDQENARNFSIEFNLSLATQLDALSGQFLNTKIVQIDTFGFFNNVIQNPAAYGFSNATDACVVLPGACNNPSAHVFWDDLHPTTQVHALFADAIVSQMPVPGAFMLFVSGMAGLLLQNYRRNA